MKKLISFVAAAGLLLLSSCGTNKGIKGMKVVANRAELVDWQGASIGKEVPKWVECVNDGNNNVDTILTKNNNNINGIPEKLDLDTKFANTAVINSPIFVYFNNDINIDAKNTSTITLPISSNECEK